MKKNTNRLYLLRKQFNLSIKQLSNSTKISIYIIKKAEINILQIKSKNLIKLAEFFNVSTDYLLKIEKELIIKF